MVFVLITANIPPLTVNAASTTNVTFDFESNTSCSSSGVTQTKPGYTLTLTQDTGNLLIEPSDGPAENLPGNAVVIDDSKELPHSLTLSLAGGSLFDLAGITILNPSASDLNLNFTTSSGTVQASVSSSGAGDVLTFSDTNLQGVNSVVITSSDNSSIDLELDNIILNIPTPSSAGVENVTVGGTQNSVITPQDVVITLVNDSLKNAINEGADLSSWITNLPAGLTATAKTTAASGAASVTITIAGTPTAASSGAMEIKIPGASLTSSADLTVAANPNAKYAIVAVKYTPPYISPTPVEENIPVSIRIGTGQDVININAVRTLDTDGVEKETLKLDENTSRETVEGALKNKTSEASIVLPDSTQYSGDKLDIQLSKDSLGELAGASISLSIESGKAAVQLPAETIAALKDEDAEIQISQVTDSSQISETKSLILQLASGSQVVSTPVSIKTNFSGRAKITLPIDASKFSSKEELEKYISSLAVIVQHSSGENVVDKGTIEYDSNGYSTGISIWVNEFSNFTLVQLPDNYFEGRTTVMPDKVAPDKEWQIKFTKAADPSTVTEDNVYVTDSKGNKVDVKVSYSSDNILKVSPVNPYTPGETYYLYISKNVTSKDKTPLVSKLRYQFTVK